MAVMAFNTSVHSLTGYTPAVMVYGQELRSPLDTMQEHLIPSEYPNAHNYVMDLLKRLSEFRRVAKQSVNESINRSVARQPQRIVPMVKMGDKVMIRNEGVS